MKSRIAAGGGYRHYLGQSALESQSIEEKYADELAKAGPEEKKRIYERMADEAMRRAKMLNHKPSAGSLW